MAPSSLVFINGCKLRRELIRSLSLPVLTRFFTVSRSPRTDIPAFRDLNREDVRRAKHVRAEDDPLHIGSEALALERYALPIGLEKSGELAPAARTARVGPYPCPAPESVRRIASSGACNQEAAGQPYS